MKNEKIDLTKINNIYDIAGSWVWQYGRCQMQYVWDRTSSDKPFLLNKHTGECISGLKKIKKYCEINNLELERF